MIQRRIENPTAEPLDLELDVKAQVRIDHHEEDSYLEGLIRTARMMLEAERALALLTQTWELGLSVFPCGAIVLPKAPLQSVTWIKYIDTAGVEQTWDSAQYTVITQAGPKARRAQILPVFQAVYPSTQCVPEAVTIRYIAGFGSTRESVPEALRQALLLHIAELYRDREMSVTGTIVNDRPAYERLVSSSVEITA